tara:strand:+ start:15 stop:431 length:417 start_codon:yes stop_codon:yes gene_type:complete
LSVLEKDLNPDVKIGLSLPMDHTDGSGFFPGTSTTLTQTSSNIRNLLLTNKGERVGQPEFGCGLLQILFEPLSENLLESVKTEIETSIAFWLPHVTISNIAVEQNESEPHQLDVKLEFALTIQPTVHEVITLSFLVGE